MAIKTKSVELPPAAKQGEIAVNFGNVEALKLRLLNEINLNLKKILEKLDESKVNQEVHIADNPITDDINVVLYDDSGNKIGTNLNNSIYRLESRASISSPNGADTVTVTTDGSLKRLDVSSKDINAGLSEQGKVYSIVVDALAIFLATAAPFVLIRNPNASGKLIKILSISYSTDAATAILRLFRNPTITTNGVAINPVNLFNGGAASVATVFRSSTVSVSGTQLTTVYTNKGDLSFIGLVTQPIIQANENLLITLQPQANKTHYITIIYSEV